VTGWMGGMGFIVKADELFDFIRRPGGKAVEVVG